MNSLRLAEIQTMESVAELRARLLECLAQGGAVTIDAGETRVIDTASLQVLAAFCREVEAVEFLAPAQGFLDAVRLLGLRQALGV